MMARITNVGVDDIRLLSVAFENNADIDALIIGGSQISVRWMLMKLIFIDIILKKFITRSDKTNLDPAGDNWKVGLNQA